MSRAWLAHPSEEQLSTFGLGKADHEEASAIRDHLEVCGECRALVEAVPDDTLASLVRQAATPPDERGALASPGPPTFVPQRMDPEPPQTAAPEVPVALAQHPRYHVVGWVGQGGMGTVYKAEHSLMGRLVALKAIRRDLSDRPALVERFRREVKTAAQLDHPNIVRAYDAEQAGDTHFLVMEWVPGTTLARLVQARGPLAVAEACEYVRQAALGLQYAFEHGMVHRDIKPQNLMVSPPRIPRRDREGAVEAPLPDGRGSEFGVVKVLDFGLARLARELGPTDAVTSSGMVLGTADYIAPEQANDPHAADIRADIYSLGCTLYFLLTAQAPFPGGTVMQKLMAHSQRALPPQSTFRDDVPVELQAILDRMTAKEPERRYQAPVEVARALAPFTRPTPTSSAESSSTMEFIRAPTGSRRHWFAAAVAALLLLGAGLLAFTVIRIVTDKGELMIETDRDDVEVLASKGGKVVKIIDTKSGKQVTLDSGDYELMLSGQAEGLRLSLDKVTLKRGKTVLARIERVAKPVADEVDEIRELEALQEAHAKAGDLDGALAVRARIRQLKAMTSTPRAASAVQANNGFAAFLSPDGSKLACRTQDGILRFFRFVPHWQDGREFTAPVGVLQLPLPGIRLFSLLFCRATGQWRSSLHEAARYSPGTFWPIAGHCRSPKRHSMRKTAIETDQRRTCTCASPFRPMGKPWQVAWQARPRAGIGFSSGRR
jgi:serine/threonine protein kinase